MATRLLGVIWECFMQSSMRTVAGMPTPTAAAFRAWPQFSLHSCRADKLALIWALPAKIKRRHRLTQSQSQHLQVSDVVRFCVVPCIC